jgi:hypothetical protein
MTAVQIEPSSALANAPAMSDVQTETATRYDGRSSLQISNRSRGEDNVTNGKHQMGEPTQHIHLWLLRSKVCPCGHYKHHRLTSLKG